MFAIVSTGEEVEIAPGTDCAGLAFTAISLELSDVLDQRSVDWLVSDVIPRIGAPVAAVLQ